MGLSSNGSSLLHKLGRKPAYDLSQAELESLVAASQKYRTIARAMGRAARLIAEKPKGKGKAKTKRAHSLDSYVAAAIAIALRKKWPDKTDPELISMLQGKGIL